MAHFEIGDRVVIRYSILPVGPAGPLFILFRAEVIGAYVTDGIQYFSMRRDDGAQDAFPHNPGLIFAEGDLIPVVSGNTIAEFQANAENSSFQLESGDAGQVVITGFGLGVLALVPGVRTVFAGRFREQGMILAGITGDGFNKFVIHWEIPEVLLPGSYDATPSVIIIPPLILVAAVILALAALGWQLTHLAMSLKATPGSPAKPAVPVHTGDPGPKDRVMVRKSDGSLVPPGANGIPVCDDPLGCTLLYEPAIEGDGILGDLKPLIWGAGILVGGLIVVKILDAIPRRSNGR